MSTEKVLTGGCTCGGIRYEITADDLNAAICHCRDCQRNSGGPFVVWMGISPEDFRLTQGAVTEFQTSKWVKRGFCSACGATLTYRLLANENEINIAGGSLDDPNTAPPAFQIFPGSRPHYMHGFDENLPVKDVEAYFRGLRER